MAAKYCIGVDFGTLSARALLVDVADGRELATATMDYPHAVMDEQLPDGTKLAPDWALEHPQDYMDTLGYTVNEVLRQSAGSTAIWAVGVIMSSRMGVSVMMCSPGWACT